MVVFELDSDYTNVHFKGFQFVTQKNIELDYINFLEKQNNTILIFGSPEDNDSGIDYETGTGTIHNQTYCTFSMNIIMIMIFLTSI